MESVAENRRADIRRRGNQSRGARVKEAYHRPRSANKQISDARNPRKEMPGRRERCKDRERTRERRALSPFDRSFESDFRERHPSPVRTLELAGQVRDGRRWKINGELHRDSVKMDSPLSLFLFSSPRCCSFTYYVKLFPLPRSIRCAGCGDTAVKVLTVYCSF